MDPDAAMDLDINSRSPAPNEESQFFSINGQEPALDEPGDFVRDPMDDLDDSDEDSNMTCSTDLTVSTSDHELWHRWKKSEAILTLL